MISPNIIRKSKWEDTCEIFSTVLVRIKYSIDGIYNDRSSGYFHLQRPLLHDFLRMATKHDTLDKAECYNVQRDKICQDWCLSE